MLIFQNNFDIIFVPQGSEYRAVTQGIRKNKNPTSVIPIPMGYPTSKLFLQQWLECCSNLPRQVLLIGLAGSLSPQYQIGEIVVYQRCGNLENNQVRWRDCDVSLRENVNLVQGWTSDRIICTTLEKQHLFQNYGVKVVDMEGFAVLEVLQPMGIKVSILRVISDDVHHNLPNLEGTINPNGQLQPIPLAIKMLQQPIASLRLIQGSLKGLKVLEQIAQKIG